MINPQTGKRCSTHLRKPSEGGHHLQPWLGKWWCSVCRVKSSTWSRLAPQRCHGSAAATWSEKALQDALSTGGSARMHQIVVSHPVFWCTTCGACGERSPQLLAKQCRGPQSGRGGQSGLKKQLRYLRAGKHPETRLPLPPPIPLKQWEATNSTLLSRDPVPSASAPHQTSPTTALNSPGHSSGEAVVRMPLIGGRRLPSGPSGFARHHSRGYSPRPNSSTLSWSTSGLMMLPSQSACPALSQLGPGVSQSAWDGTTRMPARSHLSPLRIGGG